MRSVLEKVAIYAMQMILDYFTKKYDASSHADALKKIKEKDETITRL